MTLNYSNSDSMLTRLVLIAVAMVLLGANSSSLAQKNKKGPPVPVGPLLTRTVSRHEVRRFGYGGTVTVVGAPHGSITIEGWAKNEIDITAEIEVQAANEEDLARLAAINGFFLDDQLNHLSVLTTGMHDRSYMRKHGKNFPKQLLGLPWKIDYRLRVPIATQLDINGGIGAINLSGVEGAVRLGAPQTEAMLTLIGGVVDGTFGAGTVNVRIPTRSWRGGGLQIQLATGDLNVELPAAFSGDIDADILRTGKIENTFPGLEVRERTPFTEKSIQGRAGAGGAYLKFSVGAGTIRLTKSSRD
ncbi:MAG: hypothetical protein JWM21_2701 [Acidobacteria bacterium]|nr:hypothetical protein [Acidobacteriota bacterium]